MAGQGERDLLLYLRDLSWRDVDVEALGAAPLTGKVVGAAASPADALAALASAVSSCQQCRLAALRRNVVFGVGNPKARLMFVGEGPGADEDAQGEPFVGRAGRLLMAMLQALSLRRQDVYIANIVKCRPPGNREPETDEAASCLPYLRRQIELVNPEVVVLLGRTAARFLLALTSPIGSYHGRWMEWEGRKVLPIFHPAYLLRNPAAKAQAWAGLSKLRRFVAPT